MATKIRTYGSALETVENEGEDTYVLPGGCDIRYHADEQRVVVEGYGSFDVNVTDTEGPWSEHARVRPTSAGARRLLKPYTLGQSEKMRKLRKRVEALVRHGTDADLTGVSVDDRL